MQNIGPSLTTFQQELIQGSSFLVEELWETPLSLLATLAVQTTKRSLLLVTSEAHLNSLFTDLSYFAPHLVIEFPSWETLPAEEIPPSPDILGKRFEALYCLLQTKDPSIVLCPLHALLQKLPSPPEISPLLTTWEPKMALPFETLAETLTSLGYERRGIVSDKGQFALRGGIVDLFPVAASSPFRIEFFGDEITQIRAFDPIGQKSIDKVKSFFLSPAQELPLLQKAQKLVSVVDYLGENPLLLFDGLIALEEAVIKLQEMPGAKTPLFYSFTELFKKWENCPKIFCTEERIEKLSSVHREKNLLSFEMFGLSLQATRFLHPFKRVDLEELPEDLLFIASNEAEEAAIKKRFPQQKAHFARGTLTSGFCLADVPSALIPTAELTKKPPMRRQKWRSTTHTPPAEFHELSPGDLVVHFHSGIARYLGTEKQTNHLGVETEFLVLEYAEQSKLFVPLSQAHLVSRYIGTKEELPTLSQLGSKRWQTTRAAAQAQIVGYANELLQLYAERVVQGGFRFRPDSPQLLQFEEAFPYTETEDQQLAIDAIKQDMTSEKPMDRLVCGDVGYGKTEVAMRAAFKAVVDGGKQVALLVPTTVLALQHFETFSERMYSFPIQIGVVSRFSTPKENRKILEKARRGELDILIGTHRLLSKDVQFKNLGLLIIDEEQRFGVRAKEHLKKRKIGIDCLTLSATPIPRTLYMSLVHARDMSVINTPPQDRLPVKTIIAENDPELIQNAVLRELSREGQAFFIHNRVETIYGRAEAIQKLLPKARIGIAHGQMESDAIDTIFHTFKKGELDLLFATTLIENGVDIPNANTILIDRADAYGLADLYQLRGRVGRWNRAAYAYLLIPKNQVLPEVARKRLNALCDAGSYGGGMKIAMRDLEIRGAGNILGVQQSGQVSSIGFHLYCKLLKRAIDALKQKRPISFTETKMESSFDARLPVDYINEIALRMEIYHRLGEATNSSEIDALLAELSDRFGPPPLPVLWLISLNRIRAFAAARQITLLKFQKLTLLAERQKGKELEQKTLLLPKETQTPEAIAPYVIEQLQNVCC